MSAVEIRTGIASLLSQPLKLAALFILLAWLPSVTGCDSSDDGAAPPRASSNTDLADLSLSQGALSPGFSAATLSYTSSVEIGVDAVTVSAVSADTTARLDVAGTGSAQAAIALNVGRNPIEIVVTAEDGRTTRTYTVTVTRGYLGDIQVPDANDGFGER